MYALALLANPADAVEQVGGHIQYGLSYDEEPQDHFISTPEHDGASTNAPLSSSRPLSVLTGTMKLWSRVFFA